MKRIDNIMKFQACENCGTQAFGIIDNPQKLIEKVVCLKCGATFENGVAAPKTKQEKKEEPAKEKAIKIDKDVPNKKAEFKERLKEVREMLL